MKLRRILQRRWLRRRKPAAPYFPSPAPPRLSTPAGVLRQSVLAAFLVLAAWTAGRLPGSWGAEGRQVVEHVFGSNFAFAEAGERLRALPVFAAWSRFAQEAAAPLDGTGGGAGYPLPAAGPVVSAFGWRQLPDGRREMHEGVDVAVPVGTPVQAVAAGRVAEIGFRAEGYGLFVRVDHPGGWSTLYSHLQAALVTVDQPVARGQAVGVSGRSGNATEPGIHFEVWHNGQAVDPAGFPLGR